jgi:hypothetical protein
VTVAQCASCSGNLRSGEKAVTRAFLSASRPGPPHSLHAGRVPCVGRRVNDLDANAHLARRYADDRDTVTPGCNEAPRGSRRSFTASAALPHPHPRPARWPSASPTHRILRQGRTRSRSCARQRRHVLRVVIARTKLPSRDQDLHSHLAPGCKTVARKSRLRVDWSSRGGGSRSMGGHASSAVRAHARLDPRTLFRLPRARGANRSTPWTRSP